MDVDEIIRIVNSPVVSPLSLLPTFYTDRALFKRMLMRRGKQCEHADCFVSNPLLYDGNGTISRNCIDEGSMKHTERVS